MKVEKKSVLTLLAVLSMSIMTPGILAAEGKSSMTTHPPVIMALRAKLDPVYLIDVDKYPKFEAAIVLKNGKRIRFASVKSMMNFYYHPEKFPGYGVDPRGDEIAGLVVRDYLDGKELPAEKAWYVFGSRLAGPHGDDLIPLSSKERAELFVKRYGGTRIMSYEEMRKKGYGLIKYLDM